MGEAQLKWPDHNPYLGLNYFSREDRLLLAGRDADVAACTRRLASRATRIFMLYGHTGSGKSSFLRAGLVPSLEEQQFAYSFISTRQSRTSNFAPSFVRCTGRPLDRLAEVVFKFIDDPYFGPGRSRRVNLKRALLGCTKLVEFVNTCNENPSKLVEAISIISSKAPTTLVLILDQAEEVLTQTLPGNAQRQSFFRFLNDFSIAKIDVKLLLGIRTEHVAPFEDLFLARGLARSDIERYHLRNLTIEQVREAIFRPADNDPYRGGDDPKPPYNFEIEAEAVESLAQQLEKLQGHGGTLPVMQLVCKDLYERLPGSSRPRLVTEVPRERRSPQRVLSGWLAGEPLRYQMARARRRAVARQRRIDVGLLNDIGGVPGRMSAYLEDAVQRAHQTRGELADTDQWRSALLRLVSRAPDGTASTQIVSRASLDSYLDDAKVSKTERDYLIDYLCLPDVLVLRRFSVLNEKTGESEDRYSLGHDALALGLLDWQVQRESVGLKRRLRLARAVVVVVALVALGAFGYSQIVRASKDLARAGVYVAAAERTMVSKPEVGVKVGADAAYFVQSLDWLSVLLNGGSTRSFTDRLASVVSRIPEEIVSAGSADQAAGDPGALMLLDSGTSVAASYPVPDRTTLTLHGQDGRPAATLVDGPYSALDFFDLRMVDGHLSYISADVPLFLSLDMASQVPIDLTTEPSHATYSKILTEPDPYLYFEQDFLQSFATGPFNLPPSLDQTLDADAGAELNLSLVVSVEGGEAATPPVATITARSLGLLDYETATTPVTTGDFFAGHWLISWKGDPPAGEAVTFSAFDAFAQGELFFSPLVSLNKKGGRAEISGANPTLLPLNGEVLASTFGASFTRLAALCYQAPNWVKPAMPTRETRDPGRTCTLQTAPVPVAQDLLLFVLTLNRPPEGQKSGTFLTALEPELQKELGCSATVCGGFLDLGTKRFTPLSPKELPSLGDQSGGGMTFATTQPTRESAAPRPVALFGATGGPIQVAELSHVDVDHEKTSDLPTDEGDRSTAQSAEQVDASSAQDAAADVGDEQVIANGFIGEWDESKVGYAVKADLPLWSDEVITRAEFTADGQWLIGQIGDQKIYRWSLASAGLAINKTDAAAAPFAEAERDVLGRASTAFCAEVGRFYGESLAGFSQLYRDELGLDFAATIENHCPSAER